MVSAFPDRGTRHRLRMIERPGLRLRYHPTCECGWPGVYRTRAHKARQAYREHLEAATAGARSDARESSPPVPTPRDELPDALR